MSTITRPARPRAEAANIDIAAFILAIFFPIAGMIMGYVARGQAKRRGFQPCALNTWTIVLGWVFTVLGIVLIVVFAVSVGAAVVQVGNDYCLNHPFAASCQ
jgi:heme/copper-type cytochrome/quinol oxidase subunit 2